VTTLDGSTSLSTTELTGRSRTRRNAPTIANDMT
jgi:hypothetical protein